MPYILARSYLSEFVPKERRGRVGMVVGFTTTYIYINVHVQSVPITTRVVSSNSVHGEVPMKKKILINLTAIEPMLLFCN